MPLRASSLHLGIGGRIGQHPQFLGGVVPAADVAAGPVIAIVGDHAGVFLAAPSLYDQRPVGTLEVVGGAEASSGCRTLRWVPRNILRSILTSFRNEAAASQPVALTGRIYEGPVVDLNLESIAIAGVCQQLPGPVRIVRGDWNVDWNPKDPVNHSPPMGVVNPWCRLHYCDLVDGQLEGLAHSYVVEGLDFLGSGGLSESVIRLTKSML